MNMKLNYEIKAILRHKISYVCLGILLLANFFSMVDLERSNLNNTDANKISNYEYSIFQKEIYFENNKLADAGRLFNDVQRSNLNNYEAYTEWTIDNLREQVRLLRELPRSKERDRKSLFIELKSSLMAMNANANPEQGDAFAQEVYEVEIKQFENELNLKDVPYNSKILNTHPYINSMFSKALIHDMYTSNLTFAKYEFELLKNNQTAITFESLSPWSFLTKQISHGSILPLLIFPMGIIFAFVYLMDSKMNKSLNLLLTRPVNRNSILTLQIVALLISFALLVMISLVIPTLILGIRYGWHNFNAPILVDPGGFKSLQIYSHVDEPWINYGLSYLPSALPIQDNGFNFYISPVLEFWKLPSVLFYTLLLFITKMAVAISMGVLSAYAFNKQWKAYGFVSLLIVFYVICQTTLNGFIPMFNIFDIGACFTLAQGSGNCTWLNAMFLTLAMTLVLYGVTTLCFKRKDI